MMKKIWKFYLNNVSEKKSAKNEVQFVFAFSGEEALHLS